MVKSRKTQNATKLKEARKHIKSRSARNAKGLLKRKVQSTEKAKKSKKPNYQG